MEGKKYEKTMKVKIFDTLDRYLVVGAEDSKSKDILYLQIQNKKYAIF